VFFASNALYPISIMPGWLQAISSVNPLTYEVDSLRTLMMSGGVSAFGKGLDLLIMVTATTLLVLIGARLYPSVVT
jgi:ABC-2 type transport system permease protein